MPFKVAMSDTIFPDTAIEEEELAAIGAELVLAEKNDADSILKVAKDADALFVVYAKITRDIIEQLDNCKVISRAGIGIDNIDIEAATKKGIPVCYVPDYCWDEVSDHTLSLALALLRQLPTLDRNVKSGNWSRQGATPINALKGRTWGLLGYGNISRRVAQKAQVFGFNIIAYDPYVDEKVAAEAGVKLVDLDQLLESSDVISIHAPLTEQTRHIINEDALRKMKKTAFLVNTARGGLVDSKALAKALQEGWIRGAGIDVLEKEPPDPDEPLLKLNNAIITPHAAFYSEESMITLRRSAAQEVVRVLSNQKPKNVVNKNVLG